MHLLDKVTQDDDTDRPCTHQFSNRFYTASFQEIIFH